MKNSLGNNVVLTVFGESHGPVVGACIDGLPAGLCVDLQWIAQQMKKRQSLPEISTPRKEADCVEIVSGVFEGKTTGAPLTVIIHNQNVRSSDYEVAKYIMRPSHADYVANVKYEGNQDYRGGGHFSGRLTAAIVAIGAICLQALAQKNISIVSHIAAIQHFKDGSIASLTKQQINDLQNDLFPVIDKSVREKMIHHILAVKNQKDSVGGLLETVIYNVPAGLGEPMFDSIESMLTKGLFGIGGIKGVLFGAGFDFVNQTGSQVNDAFFYEKSKVKTKTNHSGGINGGITNGMPIVFQTVIKPTSSIGLPQETIDLKTHENILHTIVGRHDPCIVHRVRTVVESIAAIVIMDALITRYGQRWESVPCVD